MTNNRERYVPVALESIDEKINGIFRCSDTGCDENAVTRGRTSQIEFFVCRRHYAKMVLQAGAERIRKCPTKIALWSAISTESANVMTYLYNTIGGIFLSLETRTFSVNSRRGTGRCFHSVTMQGLNESFLPYFDTPMKNKFAYRITSLEQLKALKQQGFHLIKMEPSQDNQTVFGLPVTQPARDIIDQPDSFWDSILYSTGASVCEKNKQVEELIYSLVGELS